MRSHPMGRRTRRSFYFIRPVVFSSKASLVSLLNRDHPKLVAIIGRLDSRGGP